MVSTPALNSLPVFQVGIGKPWNSQIARARKRSRRFDWSLREILVFDLQFALCPRTGNVS